MFVLAEIDATGWALIIGAVFVGLTSLITSVASLILGWIRENAKIKREELIADEVRNAAKEVKQVALKQAEAATEVKEVKTTLKEATAEQKEATTEQKKILDRLDETSTESLKWSNHAYGVSLKIVADLRREKANRPEANADDQRAATDAEQAYEEHMSQQKKMDDEKAAKHGTT